MKSCGHERKNIDMDFLHESVRKAGLKLTTQRAQVLKVLAGHSGPMTAEEVFKKIRQKVDEVDLVTTYRILKKFEEAHLISRLEFGDGIARFELNLDSGHHHHHVICRTCHKVEALHLCDLGPHQKIVEAMGYKSLSHRLDFFGICSDCQA